MNLTRSRLYLLLAFLTVTVGIVTNVATDQMPHWCKPYLWLSWPILGLLVVLFIAISVRQAREEAPPIARPFEPLRVEFTIPERPKEKPKPPIPQPPTPYLAHPYPMQANFTGRAREQCELTEWFTSDTRPMFAYVAIGGMGKSALTWAWLQRDVLSLPLPGLAEEERAEHAAPVPEASRPEGILWWSFYERESTFQKFLDQALTYASGGRVDPRDIPSIRERMQALYNLLCQRRFLLVLDGVERILRAYARLDAAYRGDEFERDKSEATSARAPTPMLARFYNGWRRER